MRSLHRLTPWQCFLLGPTRTERPLLSSLRAILEEQVRVLLRKAEQRLRSNTSPKQLFANANQNCVESCTQYVSCIGLVPPRANNNLRMIASCLLSAAALFPSTRGGGVIIFV